MAKKRLFVDMDGTLAKFHDEVNYLERMFEKDFFRELEPFENMVEGIRCFIQNNPDVEVFVLSARVIGEPPYCEVEKNAWLDRYLPEIDSSHRIYTDMGKSKAEFIPGGVTKNDYLLDDYNKGLNLWLFDGGSAIKCHNNINQKGLGAYGGSAGMLWTGDMVHTDDSPDLIAAELAGHMDISYDLTNVLQNRKDIASSEIRPGSELNLNPYIPGCNHYLTRILSEDGTPERYEATKTSEDLLSRVSGAFADPLNALRWLEGKEEFLELEMEDDRGEAFRIPVFIANALSSNLYGKSDVHVLMVNGIYPEDVGSAFHKGIENAKLAMIGSIHYLDTNGKAGETAVFHSVSEMQKEIQASQNCGRPISPKWFIEPQFSQKEFTLNTYSDTAAPASFTISRENLSLAVTACQLDVDDIDSYFNYEYTYDDALLIWENYVQHIDRVAALVDGFTTREAIEQEFCETIRSWNTSPHAAAAYMIENIRDWACWCSDKALEAGILRKAIDLLDTVYAPESAIPQPVKVPLDKLILTANSRQVEHRADGNNTHKVR